MLTLAVIEGACGRLWMALQDPEPVLIFEPSVLYNDRRRLAENGWGLDLDWRFLCPRGESKGLISCVGSLFKTLASAKLRARMDISAEVLDSGTSFAKTHHALIVVEEWETGVLQAGS